MSKTLEQLASASGEKKQELNITLAQTIAEKKDKKAIHELIEGLTHKTKSIRHDCIKTLYELAELAPELMFTHANIFLELLKSDDNRMQWGAMTALSAIANQSAALLFKELGTILQIADEGSVITKDHGVKILIALSQHGYEKDTIPLLLEQILKAPNNQFPSYAEQALPIIIKEADKDRFKKILTDRVNQVEPESKRKRVEKILKKL